MQGVGKIYPPSKQVLRDIYLSFYYGAKIGVLGLNGAGKSTLLKIMAGVEKNFNGEAKPGEGITVGYLPQEPQLDETKTVKENVMDGMGPIVKWLKRFEEIGQAFADPEPRSRQDGKAPGRARRASGKNRARQRLGHRSHARHRDGRAPLSAGRAAGEEPLGRRKAPRGALPPAAPEARYSAARRADQPSRRRIASRGSSNSCKQYQGTVVAVTHDRYFLDNIAGWILELDRGHGIPWEGNYSSWLEQKQKRLALEEKHETKRQKTLERELEWIRMSPRARQAKSKARVSAYEKLLAEDRPDKDRRESRSTSRRARASATSSSKPTRSRKALRRQAAFRGSSPSISRRAASWASSAATAPAKRRSSA